MGRQPKLRIMYFYSDLYENERKLHKLIKRLREEIGGVRIHLVNVEDPENNDITELYDVNVVPLVIFLTPKGEVAARKSVPLSEVKVIYSVADKVCRGELPDPETEKVRHKVLEAFKTITQRSDLTQLIIEQVRNDILEADSEAEIYELLNSHISLINHTTCDLQEFKKALQRFSKKPNFVV